MMNEIIMELLVEMGPKLKSVQPIYFMIRIS